MHDLICMHNHAKITQIKIKEHSPKHLTSTFLKYKFIYFNCWLITLQYCIGFAIHQYESAPGVHVFHFFQSENLWTEETSRLSHPQNYNDGELTTIEYLGDTLSRAYWDKPKLKDKLLYFMSPTTKKEAQFPVSLWEFWRWHTTHLGKNVVTHTVMLLLLLLLSRFSHVQLCVTP